MIFYKNDPKYKILLMSKNRLYYTVGNVKIIKDNKNTKTRFLKILIKLIQSTVKSVYDRGYRGNFHQFQ
ncbi:hypothetical protein C6497_06910 [Candidatus Poribacteria bacterium]|nr:MAG: hypothetical protein C6497_06910 [Candidatus Poribacteria bacterium]